MGPPRSTQEASLGEGPRCRDGIGGLFRDQNEMEINVSKERGVRSLGGFLSKAMNHKRLATYVSRDDEGLSISARAAVMLSRIADDLEARDRDDADRRQAEEDRHEARLIYKEKVASVMLKVETHLIEFITVAGRDNVPRSVQILDLVRTLRRP